MAYTTIDDPSAYFKVQLYTGTGSSHAITFNDTDTDMQPDLIWNKSRSDNFSQNWCDSLRGVTKMLEGDANAAENTNTNAVTAFGSDGFTVGSDNGNNKSSSNFVAWCWKANGPAASVSANTDGSINTTKTSANTTSGFSINTFTGSGSAATVGHGLGAVPRMIISKDYGGTNDWYVYHAGVGNTHALRLSTNDNKDDSDGYWNDTTPTSTVYSVGNNSGTNDTDTMVSYVFTPKQGFSAINSFTGNGNANGSYVHLGFRPAMVILKNSDSSGTPWTIWDNKRPGHNVNNLRIRPDTADDEDTTTADPIDFLSNGFKCRGNNDDTNKSGSLFIYIAFAEAPFVNSKGVPANAR